MNVSEYSKTALTTAIYPSRGANLPYAVLGLVEETQEFVDVFCDKDDSSIKKEAGDVLWYLNAIAFEAKFDAVAMFGTPPVKRTSVNSLYALQSEVAKIAGLTKKSIRDDDGRLSDDRRSAIRASASAIVAHLKNLISFHEMTVEQVMETNISKLLDRKARGVLKGSGDNR